MPRAKAPYTMGHIAQALARMRGPGWPANPQDCLAHAIYGPCVRGLARALARAAAKRTTGLHALPGVVDDPKTPVANDHAY